MNKYNVKFMFKDEVKFEVELGAENTFRALEEAIFNSNVPHALNWCDGKYFHIDIEYIENLE